MIIMFRRAVFEENAPAIIQDIPDQEEDNEP
jgi:hypothetical protein